MVQSYQRKGAGGMHTRLDREQGVYTLTLNRPEAGNAVNAEMTRQLVSVLEVVERDTEAVALILTGAGDRFFCTGGDVKEYAGLSSRSAVEAQFVAMQRVCERLEKLPIPSIAAVNGLAVGGGAELSLACDFRVAKAGITMSLRQVHLGLITGWGAHWRLLRVLGEARTLDLLLTGRSVSAEEALMLGLVHRVSACALAEARNLAEDFRKAAPLALRAMKEVVREGADQSYSEALAGANQRFLALWFSADHREAERAFGERRQPHFRGE